MNRVFCKTIVFIGAILCVVCSGKSSLAEVVAPLQADVTESVVAPIKPMAPFITLKADIPSLITFLETQPNFQQNAATLFLLAQTLISESDNSAFFSFT